jgi:hypothetical protein
MKFLAQWLSSAIVVVVVVIFFSATRPALADSYTIYDLGNDNGHGIYGIDSFGDVVTWATSGCGSSSYCYATYVNGVATADGGTPPVLEYDNGSSCGSTPAGFNAAKSVCNNGWTGMGTFYNPNGDPNGVYLASVSEIDFLGSGAVGQAFLNSFGDFAWTDSLNDEMYVEIQNSAPLFEDPQFANKTFVASVPTPEPPSLFLMATGLVGLTAVFRGKANRY